MKRKKRQLRLHAETVRVLSEDLVRVQGGVTVPLTHASGCMTVGNGTDCDPPPVVGGGR